MNAGNRRGESEFRLSQFEPDPEGFGGCPDPGPPVEVLEWLTWIDAARELAWVEVEAMQIIPRLPAL